MMVGGYSSVSLPDDGVTKAATFAMSDFYSSPHGRAYGAPSTLSDTVLRAERQVVAGMNYKMHLVLKDKESGQCVAVHDVVVYDRFGTLKVTQREFLPCSEWMHETR